MAEITQFTLNSHYVEQSDPNCLHSNTKYIIDSTMQPNCSSTNLSNIIRVKKTVGKGIMAQQDTTCIGTNERPKRKINPPRHLKDFI